MKMMKRHILAQAVVLAASALVSQWSLACPANMAKPFTAGPIAQQPAAGSWGGPFSEWIVDANGVGLQLCTDSVTNDGTPPPCFYDPISPATPYTSALTRGGEAFFFLADSVFTTNDATGALGLDAVIVMGVESAFLSDPPAPGFETQFQRLRTRINVAKTGVYHVETPWGTSTYRVDTLLPPGNGQNRSEISEPIDITFAPGPNAGMVTPFLLATNMGGIDPAQYIGDGVTLTTATGSPCGQNYVKVTAFALDTVTPIDINAGSNVYVNNQFTVMGKRAAAAAVPLSIGASYYTRTAGVPKVSVMATGSTSATAQAAMTVKIGDTTVAMARDTSLSRFYATTGSTDPLPARITVVATDAGLPSTPNTQTSALTDLVTISSAVAHCSGAAATRSCVLDVAAQSSDDGSGPNGTPQLTLVHNNTPLSGGLVSISGAAVPANVTVKSSFGGTATKPVTLINQ